MLVESPKRLNNHRPKSKKALNGSITPKMNRHRRSVWQTWRPNHAGAWRAAETMLQELVYLCRWRSNWRLSQKLCSDNVIGLADVDHNHVRSADQSGRETGNYQEHTRHRSNEKEISHGRVSWQAR